MQAKLFVVLECDSNDELYCFQLIHFYKKYGIEPMGPHMERYRDNDMEMMQVLIPVRNLAAFPVHDLKRRAIDKKS
ncbi:hypothetical protein FE783_15190 [Paenibacillus mesophilus]|uniref:hypothetical protein n=1 Tax=Paenibacillus mesophilus TaxID=2582849 RepID=UPI00110F5191|nr:hypothetical protein [Paenibacillus mesophilus]TMV49013.1 hypothetical protein FE783_15190 [Paenibacillus mesophilus]